MNSAEHEADIRLYKAWPIRPMVCQQIGRGWTMTKKALEKLIRYTEDHPYHRFIGVNIEEIKRGTSIVSMTPAENMLTIAGVVHAGVYYTILEVAAFLACVSISPDDQIPATTNINVSVMRAVSKGDLKVKAKVLKIGKRNCFIESRILDEDGNVIATGLITKAMLPHTK